MKKYLGLIFSLLFLLCLNLTDAEIIKGNPSFNIEKVYGEGEILRGWINISLNNESVSSEFSCFDVKMNILEFLNKINADYECSDEECGNESTINLEFQKINLAESGCEVPSAVGDYPLLITLGDEIIVEKSLEVRKGLKILGINTKNAIAAVPVQFIVHIFGKNITKYRWDFGDDSSKETIDNKATHTYDASGNYTLKIEIENDAGGITIEEFSISVDSPKNAINATLAEKKQDIENLKQKISSIAGWYNSIIEDYINLEEIEAQIKTIEKEYEKATEESEYIEIMSKLISLEIPITIEISQPSKGEYFPDPYYINANHVIDLGGQQVNNSEDYNEAIVSWFSEYVDVEVESNIYTLLASDYTKENILTNFKLKILPKKSFDKEVYLVIDHKGIQFAEDYGQKETELATGIVFPEIREGEEEDIEFIVKGSMEILELPLYLSPELSELEVITDIAPCNFNKRCEKELGENSENCRSDCKPWRRIALYLGILFLAGFIAYIGLQEWYKRYYESYLFKNKADLFNMIAFINNALNQGYDKKSVIKILKKYKWKEEQIIYCLKKIKGKRTGMFEIPIFSIFNMFRKKKLPPGKMPLRMPTKASPKNYFANSRTLRKP